MLFVGLCNRINAYVLKSSLAPNKKGLANASMEWQCAALTISVFSLLAMSSNQRVHSIHACGEKLGGGVYNYLQHALPWSVTSDIEDFLELNSKHPLQRLAFPGRLWNGILEDFPPAKFSFTRWAEIGSTCSYASTRTAFRWQKMPVPQRPYSKGSLSKGTCL